MTVADIIKALPLTVIAAAGELSKPVEGGYVSDLLSNVMGFAKANSVWITMQGHQNVVAVASLANLSAVIIAGGASPEADAVKKAEAEGVVLLATDLPAFEVAGQLYGLGVRGL
ncbi:MAG TPA: DRTGG domain-containing protein [Selenomonadales bacterium]|nr:DRTGG domain-containing protein [Selenomonadales bacterium]